MFNLLITLCVFITTSLTELLFHIFQKSPFEVPLQNILALGVVLFFMSFTRSKVARILLMNMIIIFSFFQMMHIQFYSIPVYPNAILLFFTETSEVLDTLFQNLILFFLPLCLLIPGVGMNLFMEKYLKNKNIKIKTAPYLHFLFLFYLMYNPIRTYATANTWGRQPSGQELMGMNIYLSLSYFSGRILPFKLLNNKHLSTKYPNIKLSSIEPFNGNIILIVGESLSSNHMSLFNYPRETTPFLRNLKSDPNFESYEGISNAVSTDVSVALLFNTTYGLNGINDIGHGKNCLFSLAKKNGFQTSFYSTQSSQQLRYVINSICPKSIDQFKSLEDIQPNIENANKADDRLLVDLLPENDNHINNKFIVLHQRGSHSPYNLRYKENKKNFKLSGNYNEDRINHYDNTVIDFDLFMEKLIHKISNYTKPVLIIYTSDHGEGLGEEGVFGHAALKRPSFQIPILFYQANTKKLSDFQMPKTITQFHISLIITHLIGFKTQYPLNTPPPEYKILGNDLDGFAGFLSTEFKNGVLKNTKLELL